MNTGARVAESGHSLDRSRAFSGEAELGLVVVVAERLLRGLDRLDRLGLPRVDAAVVLQLLEEEAAQVRRKQPPEAVLLDQIARLVAQDLFGHVVLGELARVLLGRGLPRERKQVGVDLERRTKRRRVLRQRRVERGERLRDVLRLDDLADEAARAEETCRCR